MPNPIINRRIIFGSGYTPIMQAYINRVALEGGTLTESEKWHLNQLTQSSAIGELDRLWIHGVSNQVAARVSLVNAATADLLTEVNSPTWTAYEGYQGNGTTQYINTNYNPTTDGVKYTLNSACLAVYCLSEQVDNSSIAIGATDQFLYLKLLGNRYPYLFSILADAATVNPSTLGLFTANRIGNSIGSYKNGVSGTHITLAPAAIPNLDMCLLACNFGAVSNYSTNKISVSFLGSGAIDQAQFYTDIQTLGTSLGWAV